MSKKICPFGFDCSVMVVPRYSGLSKLPVCPNRFFCLEQAKPRPIQPLFNYELSWVFSAFYDRPYDETPIDEVRHYKFVYFPEHSYNVSEILDLIEAGFAEPVRIDAVSHNFGIVSAVDDEDQCEDDEDYEN